MASKAIKPKRDDNLLAGWESRPETAPSIVREAPATTSRILALVGLILAAVGLFAVIAPFFNRAYILGPSTGVFALAVGLFLLVYHALSDNDIQYRLMYLIVGCIGIGVAVVMRVFPLGGAFGALFLPVGVPSMLLGLIFALCAIRHETDAKMRLGLTLPIGVVGFVMVVLGSFVGHLNAEFLVVEGVVLSVVGLIFILAFIAVQGAAGDVGFGASVGLGLVGALGLILAIARSYLERDFFIPSGLLLALVSLAYVIVALALYSDWPVLVLFRRELKSFFLSPIGFLVLLGNVLLAWLWFFLFIGAVRFLAQPGEGGLPEPVVKHYLFNYVLVIALSFIVPVLSMRLFSEEKRSGTLEVLLTAPVSEMSVVLGKFFAALTLYLFCWLPWLGFLLALRVYGGVEFEYQPLLSFLPVLLVTGMAFVAFGVFFSATTSNQIIAAVFTFVAILLMWLPFFLRMQLQLRENSIWYDVVTYISPLDLWQNSLYGILAPRYFLYFISLAVFFLFLTTKVLEARRWK